MVTKTKQPDIIPTKDIYAGTENAKIIITAYMDYESEACAQLNEVLNILLEKYEGSLRINIRHFPLTKIHQRAQKAAEAAVGAAQEGKFWEMNNMLYQHRKNLGTISLKSYAKDVGIKNKNFLNNLVNATYSWHVRGDLLDALAKGIRDVPVIFINNVQVQKPTYQTLKKQIDALIK